MVFLMMKTDSLMTLPLPKGVRDIEAAAPLNPFLRKYLGWTQHVQKSFFMPRRILITFLKFPFSKVENSPLKKLGFWQPRLGNLASEGG